MRRLVQVAGVLAVIGLVVAVSVSAPAASPRWRMAVPAEPHGSGVLALGLAGPGSTARKAAPSPVEDILASCPTASEIAAIDARIRITIEGDPTAGTGVCGMTQLRARAYQTLRVIQRLHFTEQLPWTSESLWGWFTGAIDGIRFRSDITQSFCCDPPGTINVQTHNLAALATSRWIGSPTATSSPAFPGLRNCSCTRHATTTGSRTRAAAASTQRSPSRARGRLRPKPTSGWRSTRARSSMRPNGDRSTERSRCRTLGTSSAPASVTSRAPTSRSQYDRWSPRSRPAVRLP